MGVIAEGDIRINLQDAGARRELRALTADVKRTFEDISRQEAHPSVDLDNKDFERSYQLVQRQLDKLRSEKASAVAKLDVRGMQKAAAQIALLETKLRKIDGRRYAALLRVDVDKEGTRAVGQFEKMLDRLRDPKFFQNLRGKVGIDLDEGDLRRIEQEIQNRITKFQRIKTTAALHFDTGGIVQAETEIANLRRLLSRVTQEADSVRAGVRRDPLKIPVELDRRELRQMEHELLATVAKLKREKVKLRIDADTEGVHRVTNELAQLDQDLIALRRRRIEIAIDFDRSKIDQAKRLFSAGGAGLIEGLQNTAQKGAKWWNEFGGSVLGAGIRLGPLTLRLRTALSVMTVLGPLLISLTGAFGALGSVLYASVIGALGPATAGVGALGIGLAGIGGILVPLVKDFGNAQKAVSAYDKAVREHGKNSDQAAKKMEVLQNVMGSVGPGTRDAVRDVGKLGGMWRRLTKDARPAFFDTIAEGVRSAKSLMPLFARESTKTFQLASKEVQNWFKGLRGQEARGIFRSLFEGAQAAIPSLQRSLGNVFTFLGRVAKAAMPLFTQFTKTLEGWTKGWADSAKDQSGVVKFLNRMKDALVDTGQFVGSLARLFHNLFMGGTEAGRGLLDTLTDLFNRWADWAGSIRGQNELHDFFSRSVNLALDFGRILKNVFSFFTKAATSPLLQAVTQGIVKTIELLTDLLNIVPHLNQVFAGMILGATFLRALGPISKLIAAMGALKAAAVAFAGAQGMGRAVDAISAFGGRYRQILGRPGGAVPGALTTVGAEAGGAALGQAGGSRLAASRDAQAAAGKKLLVVEKGIVKEVGESGAVALAASGRFGLLARALTVATGPVGIATVAITGLAIGIQKLQGASTLDKYKGFADSIKASHSLIGATSQAFAGLTQASFANQSALLSVKSAQQEVNRLRRAGKQGTTEYEQALFNLTQAEEGQRVSQQQLVRSQRTAHTVAQRRIDTAKEAIAAAIKAGAEESKLGPLYNQLAKAQNAGAAAAVNIGRSQRGLAALVGNTGQQVGYLVRQFAKMPRGDTIRKFFVQADTKQAEAGIRNIKNLQRQGISDKQIISVVANTDSAETALAKLRALSRNLPKLEIDAKDNATPKVNKAVSSAMRLVRPFVALLTGNDKASGKAGGAVRAAQRLVRTFAAMLQAKDSASPAIRGAIGLLNAFDGRNATSTITTIRRQVTQNYQSGRADRPSRARAEGAVESPAVKAKYGARVNRTTFVTGEENRTEFVIATNPNYRTRNRKILKVAAAALGVRDLADNDEAMRVVNDDRETYLGFPAYAKGKGPSKRVKRQRRKRVRQIGRLKRKWNREVRGEQSRVEGIERDIRNKIQTRDQDETQFSINLDNDPIIKERPGPDGQPEEYVDERAKGNRISAIQNLMEQTQKIVKRYDDLKAALKRAIDKMKEVTDKLRKRLSTVTRKRVGKDAASKLRGEITNDIEEIAGDRRDAAERLGEIGDRETRGEQRSEQLQYNTYDSELRQARAVNVNTSAAKAAGGTDNTAALDQAKAQAAYFQRTSEINEAALRAFGGPGDISSGGRTAYSALSGRSGGILTPPAATPSMGAALASAAAQGASQALSVAGAGRNAQAPTGGAGGGGPTVIVQTLHPGDPATLDAIGRAATSGISLQGAQLSAREATGL